MVRPVRGGVKSGDGWKETTDSVAGGSAKLPHHTQTDTGGLSRALISNTRHVNSNFYYSLHPPLRSSFRSRFVAVLFLGPYQCTHARTRTHHCTQPTHSTPSNPAIAFSRIMKFPKPMPFPFMGRRAHPRFFTSSTVSGPAPLSPRPPYFVPRNARGSLPVYSDVRNGGMQYLISVRNVEGNIKVSDPVSHHRSPLIFSSHQRLWQMI
jgi:hypothetical protein